MRVFYSWQSDRPNRSNRSLIQTALERAARAIRNDGSLDVEPVIDRDTQGLSGSPLIATAIFNKIATAAVFVADVTIVNGKRGRSRRPTPNPNVLIELGFALRALGAERIILIQNTHHGDPSRLPFDLKMHRIVTYSVDPESDDPAPARRKLTQQLEKHLGSALRVAVEGSAKQDPPFREILRRNDAISLDEFVDRVFRDIQTGIRERGAEDWTTKPEPSSIQSRALVLEDAVEPLLPMCADAGRWCTTEQALPFQRGMVLLLRTPRQERAFFDVWEDLHRYPLTLLSYAGGVASVEAENWHFLLAMLSKPTGRRNSRNVTALRLVHPFEVFRTAARGMDWDPNAFTPASDHLGTHIRPHLRELLPDDGLYFESFDRFEFLLSMLWAHDVLDDRDEPWVPVGSFLWRRRRVWQEEHFRTPIEASGDGWGPLA